MKEDSINLATVQKFLEQSAKELKLAQSNFKRAAERLSGAEKSYETAVANINAATYTVKQRNKVRSINLD